MSEIIEKGYPRVGANVRLSPGCFPRENYQINKPGEVKQVFHCLSIFDPSLLTLLN